jgi:hypothetical protein
LKLVEPLLRPAAKIRWSASGDRAELVFVGEDGFAAGPELFAAELRRSQPALFRAAEPQATDRKKSPAYAGPNPYRKSMFNLTKQFALERSEPATAAALRRAAEEEECSK